VTEELLPLKAGPCVYCNGPVASSAKTCPRCGGESPYPAGGVSPKKKTVGDRVERALDESAKAGRMLAVGFLVLVVMLAAFAGIIVAAIVLHAETTAEGGLVGNRIQTSVIVNAMLLLVLSVGVGIWAVRWELENKT
jgi:hypothetical protein